MYDEPGIEPSELIDRRSPRRICGGSLPRAIGAAVPAVGIFLWLSALLEVGPMNGHEGTGLLVTIAAFVIWSATLGRTVAPR